MWLRLAGSKATDDTQIRCRQFHQMDDVDSNLHRYLPEIEFPPYSYVPGQAPHPVSDPAGHSYEATTGDRESERPPAALTADNWQTSPAYLFAVDLFNNGYYWEAHEEWEGAWHALGRTGTVADFLKGLIKLAAAGVKLLEGNAVGGARHASRAAELFQSVETATINEAGPFLGQSVPDLIRIAERAAADANTLARSEPTRGPSVVFEDSLRLGDM